MQVHEKLFIGGEWVAPAGTDVINVISPHSEELVGSVPEGTAADIDRAVAAARTAFDEGEWPRMSPEERIAIVENFSNLYASRLGDMAQIISDEMGSPITFAQLAQSPAPWMILNTAIQVAKEYPWEEQRTGVLGSPVTVRSEGVGVVGAIVPWNVPQFVTMSKLAPALLAGCSIVIKPSPETPLDAMLMAELLEEAGIPKGVVSVIPAGREVGEHLVRHRGVDKIAFTGSTAAGRTIASICGEQLKRVSLELGGKSAAIILDDADLGATIEGLKFASLMNNGQACVAQTRILASRENYSNVVNALGEMVAGMTVGDPSDP
ncbi:MAG: aldehyde dehydrogenase family protein, partial [Actinomycetota bacterium]|nr:aldehyde dehydrogenase family protein [Actinomycetota bacterium]